MIYQNKNGRVPVKEVVLHCAAVPTGFFKGQRPHQVFSTINRWHVERGYLGCGYHGIFMPDGFFMPARPFDQIGAHTNGHNSGTLGFLLIESVKVQSIAEFDNWFTTAQREALRAKLADLPGIVRVSGHNDYAAKLCPGFRVKTSDWL